MKKTTTYAIINPLKPRNSNMNQTDKCKIWKNMLNLIEQKLEMSRNYFSPPELKRKDIFIKKQFIKF